MSTLSRGWSDGVPDPAEAGRLAEEIAGAVTGCPSVARLSDGPIATCLPGRFVRGVSIRGGEVRIAVVAEYGRPLTQIADAVRAAVEQIVPGLRVHVTIEDVDLP